MIRPVVLRIAAVLLFIVLALAAARADAAELEPVPGSVRLGPEVADPADGGTWIVRSWRPRHDFRRESGTPRVRCLQVGRPVGKRIVRTVRGAPRRLAWRDRTVCASAARGAESPPVLVERLLGDPAAPPLQTIVAGVLRRSDAGARLEVAGVSRDLSIDPRGRAYLAVLPGSVRRSALAIELHGDSDTRRIEFHRGDGYRSLVPGTVRRGLTVPAIDGGPDLALTMFELDQLRGPRETCAEPGRAVGGEAGQYDPRWEVFLEAPTLADVPEFEDGAPSVQPPGSGGTCIDADERSEVHTVRIGPGAFAVSGVLGPSVVGFEVGARDGAAVPVASGAGAIRPVVAQVRSTGAFGDRVTVTEARADSERERQVIWLGPHDVPTSFTGYRARGRRLRMFWIGGSDPPGAVTVRERARRVRVQLTEREGPSFTDDGIPILDALIAIHRCVDVRLRRPLGKRRVIDASTGRGVHPARRGSESAHCRLSRPRG